MRVMRLVGLAALLVGTEVAHAAEESGSGWERMLLEQAARYPQWEAQDCYKLLVQATLGAEHAAPSEGAALAWMEREVSGLGPGTAVGEALWDPITPNGALGRVNLRPFLARGGDWRALARAFAATGRKQFGTRTELAERWALVVARAEDGGLRFTAEEARAFGEEMRAAGWPAVHHSARYGEVYRPAYRILAREEFAALGLGGQ